MSAPKRKDYPVWDIYTWICPECDRKHVSEVLCAEPGNSDADSFDFGCECGAYYKKVCRIPDECILSVSWRKAHLPKNAKVAIVELGL